MAPRHMLLNVQTAKILYKRPECIWEFVSFFVGFPHRSKVFPETLWESQYRRHLLSWYPRLLLRSS